MPPANHWTRFAGLSAPKPGEKGYTPRRQSNALDGRSEREVVNTMLANAVEVLNEAETLWATQAWERRTKQGDWWFADDDEVDLEQEEDWLDWLADRLDVPHLDGAGRPMPNDGSDCLRNAPATKRCPSRWGWAYDAVMLAVEGKRGPTTRWSRDELPDLFDGGPVPRTEQGLLRGREVAAAVAATLLPKRLRLVQLTKAQVTTAVATWHSQLPKLNPKGLKLATGLLHGDQLVGVATVGTPSGRWGTLPTANIIELTRIAMRPDAPLGGSSKLAAWALKQAPKIITGDPRDGWLFLTYSTIHEKGSTYKALAQLGLRPTCVNPPKTPGGQRRGSVEEALRDTWKIAWEAGPLAAPARWDLLEQYAGTGAAPTKAEYNACDKLNREHHKRLLLEHHAWWDREQHRLAEKARRAAVAKAKWTRGR